MTARGFHIVFAIEPDLTLYAARMENDNALGYTTDRNAAILFDKREDAERTLANGYGPSMAETAVVVEA